MSETVVLVDLSGVSHPIWHMSQSEPDPNHTSIQVVAKVRALASGQPHVAVCCDCGPYFRKDIDPSYKATRPESDATLQHQITLARETLVADGFPVWAVKGFEADDLIASATKIALEAGFDVAICSSDKDLLQLVGPHVTAKSLKDGTVIDEAFVLAKYKVRPDQMRDFLSLKGDKADNVVGAKDIADVKAAKLLNDFDSLEKLYTRLMKEEPAALGLTPSIAASLAEFEPRWPVVRSLIALRDDVPIAFSEVLAERQPKEADIVGSELTNEPQQAAPTVALEEQILPDGRVVEREVPAPQAGPVAHAQNLLDNVIAATPADWEKQLEPRSMRDAQILAENLFRSRLFSDYSTAPGVLAVILAGREMGIPAMASLRAFHIIKNKACPSAELLRALVLKSGKAKYFRCTERSAEQATFETQRGDNPVATLTYTMDEARASGRVKPDSGYDKDPADVLVARASSKLARLEYPDVTLGMVAFEEIENG